ncbi:MAG: hypothetical protein R3Y09_00855 [Clostridia bacterium]
MFNIFTKFLVLMSILGVVIFPTEVIATGTEAVELAFYRVIPSLFTFFVLQSLVVSMGISDVLSDTFGVIFKKIFRVSDSSPYILGIIGGYPMGFKSVMELYGNKKISKDEAERMVGFCNNAGPAFIIGFVGVFLFSNKNIGYVLLLGHILASVVVGMIFSVKNEETRVFRIKKVSEKPFYENFISAVNGGFSSVLMVCGYVIFFSIFAQILTQFNVFSTIATIFSPILNQIGINNEQFTAILIGMIEMTSGINYLQGIDASIVLKIIIASFLLAFSGASIHFQTLSFNKGLNLRKYYITKLIQSILAPIFSVIAYKIIYSKAKTVFLAGNYSDFRHCSFNDIAIITLFLLILLKKSRK